MAQRPLPPAGLLGIDAGQTFVPAPEVIEWAAATFIADGAPLQNPEHQHLQSAIIGALWTNVPNSRHGRSIVGMAERGKVGGSVGKWSRAKLEMLNMRWFGLEPDFILTFDAGYAASCSDAAFCALVEHELYHAGQEKDEFGMPRFRKESGMPAFCIRGHDVEEFTGIVKRYGAIDPAVAAMVQAVNAGPEVADAGIRAACGTCAL